MCQNLRHETSLFIKLLEIDQELATETGRQPCPFCGGPLHQAHYPRKPRGGPDEIDDALCLRFSFCCGREGCRKRVTPESTRFLGRKVYFAPVILFLTNMFASLSLSEIISVLSLHGTNRRSLYRWQHWWRNEFAGSRVWRKLKGLFSPPPEPTGLPGQLLDRFSGCLVDRIASCLSFIAPIGSTPLPPIGQAF
jgi:hypothetical protein